jgi:hypothetical protein
MVAFDPVTGAGVTINRTGSILWPALLVGATERGLADVLEAQYDLTHAQAERDVQEFLAGLRERDLLEEPPRAPGVADAPGTLR